MPPIPRRILLQAWNRHPAANVAEPELPHWHRNAGTPHRFGRLFVDSIPMQVPMNDANPSSAPPPSSQGWSLLRGAESVSASAIGVG